MILQTDIILVSLLPGFSQRKLELGSSLQPGYANLALENVRNSKNDTIGKVKRKSFFQVRTCLEVS